MDRAVQVVRAANEFEWSWTAEDLPAFAASVGWTLVDVGKEYPGLVTDFEVNRPDTTAFVSVPPAPFPRGQLNHLDFDVTDVVLDDPDVKPALNAVFDEFVQRVFETVRQRPTGWWVEPTRGLRWDLSSLVLEVTVSDRSVWVGLINPAYQQWNEEIARIVEQQQEDEEDEEDED
ncbi:DUF6301 family protein [Nocardia bovistercoris]|uniref:Uncharacterized protein n=1 Tax=Nocardia bovistercoris TaxID=2785916 RepID=A0A931N899_9NOCA|nr:DUF6301 family protein [Nocardia bovistercoris]MBH0781553.1 hypothetical protein [Nocardia bovistercoris]